MRVNKNWTAMVCAVIKGIFFIGFSIQIILGIVWMCCNFAHVQDLPTAETALYSGLFRMLGQSAPVLYLLQLAAAFWAGYFFLQSVFTVGRVQAVWRALALLTFPFAMQCHLALTPHSFVGSLFLLMLAFVMRGIREAVAGGKDCRQEEGAAGASEKSPAGSKRFGIGKGYINLGMGILCAMLLVLMCGIVDKENREVFARRGIEGNLASRFSWYTLLNDADFWSDDLREIVEDSWWTARYCPENMELLLADIEAQTTQEEARAYMRQIIALGLQYRKPTIIRLMGWDVLGYTVTPLVVPMQLAGEAYDSFTGRNYEAMGGQTPLLTKYYVNYGCWWFAVELALTVLFGCIGLWQNRRRGVEKVLSGKACPVKERAGKERARRKVTRLSVLACVAASGVLVGILTMRGAGLMDYKWSFAVNELWLVWTLLLMGKMRMRKDEVVE